jgi:hypothetical protein
MDPTRGIATYIVYLEAHFVGELFIHRSMYDLPEPAPVRMHTVLSDCLLNPALTNTPKPANPRLDPFDRWKGVGWGQLHFFADEVMEPSFG